MARHRSELLLNDGRRLGVEWEGKVYRGQPMELLVEGEPIATIPDHDALQKGWEQRLDDGSLLRFEMKKGAVFITHDGIMLREKGMKSREQSDEAAVKIAYGVLYFIGALTLLLGLLSATLGIFREMGINAAYSMVLGAAFLALGYGTMRRFSVALTAAIALYALDTVLLIVNVLQGSYTAFGSVTFHVCLLIPLIRGAGALSRIRGFRQAQ